MDEFRLNPTRTSAFQKLAAIKVNTPNEPAAQPAEKAPTPLAGLEAAVASLGESKEKIDQLASSSFEIKGANEEASNVSLRDVNKAFDLASDLNKRIRTFKDEARSAQENIRPEVVQNLLK